MGKTSPELRPAIIKRITNYASDVLLLNLELKAASDQRNLSFIPGQIVSVFLPAFGEASFGICSSPFSLGSFTLCVRIVGTVTSALSNLEEGDEIYIRGPYGNGFPVDVIGGKDLVLAGGGTGIVPLASLAEYIVEKRSSFGQVKLLYGAKSSKELLFKNRFPDWSKSFDLHLTINEPEEGWTNDVGLIPVLLSKLDAELENTVFLICGPTLMCRALLLEFKEMKVRADRIYVSLERRMRCGIGKCQHCAVAKKYVCLDGPVFRRDSLGKF